MKDKKSKKLIDIANKVDYLKFYLNIEINNYCNKYNVPFIKDNVDFIAHILNEKHFPEGVDVFVGLNMYVYSINDMESVFDNYFYEAQQEGLTLGQPVLIYMYSRIVEQAGYSKLDSYLFENSLQYCIPF